MEKSYQGLFNVMPVPCMAIKPTRDTYLVADVNEHFLKEAGVAKDCFSGRSLPEAYKNYNPHIYNTLEASLEEVLNTRKKVCLELPAFYSTKEKMTQPPLEVKIRKIENIPVLGFDGNIDLILHCIVTVSKEEAAEDQEKKFKTLVNEGSDLTGILDKGGNYTFASENFMKFFDVSSKAVIGTNLVTLIHPKDKKKFKKEFASLKQGEQKKFSHYRVKDAGGNWKWMESSAKNLLGDAAIRGIIMNSRDITAMIEQGEELKKINERYHLAVTATQDLVYDWDLEKEQVKRFHSSLKEVYGYPINEVNRMEFWQEKMHPEDLTTELPKLNAALASKKENFIKTEYRFKRSDDTYAIVVDRGYIVRDHKKKAIRLIGAVTDISEISEQREALRVSNNRFRMAMMSIDEMIWDWNIETNQIVRSLAFKNIYGYSLKKKSSPNNFWLSKIHERDRERVRLSLRRTIKDKHQKRWKEGYRFYKANGELAHVVDRGFIIRNSEGKAIRFIGAVLDLTETTQLIEEITKQNTILKEIAWQQSHIFRAPLARLKSLLQFLEYEEFDTMSREEVYKKIFSSADELDKVVREIVQKTETEFTKLGKPEVVSEMG